MKVYVLQIGVDGDYLDALDVYKVYTTKERAEGTAIEILSNCPHAKEYYQEYLDDCIAWEETEADIVSFEEFCEYNFYTIKECTVEE